MTEQTACVTSAILCLLFVAGVNGFRPQTIVLASVSTAYVGWCEIGVSYRAVDNLTVTLNSFTVVEKTGSYQYTIIYTLKNENLDAKITEGSFKMYYKDSAGGLPQYGFFNDLFPNDTVTRSYTFEELKSKPFDVLEYHHDHFFSSEPLADSLKWNVEALIPEFPSFLTLPLFMIAVLIAVVVSRARYRYVRKKVCVYLG
jgi:hypothetical protein